jgi:hypothetical protein
LIKLAGPYIVSNKKLFDIPNPINIKDSCKYHEHTVRSQPCYKTKFAWLKGDNSSTYNAAT